MKNFALTLDPKVVRDLAFKQVIPAILMGGLMLALYLLSTFVPPGAASYVVSFLALGIVILTAIARVNDIGIQLSGWRWELRRFGLVAVSAGAASVILGEGYPAWNDTMIHVGLAATWFTTPGMPPWWRYIAGKEGCVPTSGGLVPAPTAEAKPIDPLTLVTV